MSREEIFKNSKLGLQARVILGDDGSILINAEDTAVGFGWTQIKNGKLYIRWETINIYCNELGFSQEVGKDTYIPESLYYLLAMKASNEKAQKYQRWLAIEVLPSIRKHGAYMTERTLEKALQSPDFLIKLATKLKDEQEKNKMLTSKVNEQEEVIEEQRPKVTYYDTVLRAKNLITTTVIAKDYGKSAQWLNKILKEKKIIYWQGNRSDGMYHLYDKYANMGYAHSDTSNFIVHGEEMSKSYLKWTQKGRYFIYQLLKKDGILPIAEREREEI